MAESSSTDDEYSASDASLTLLTEWWDAMVGLLPDTEPERAETSAAIAAGLIVFSICCCVMCRCACWRYCLGNPFYCCCCLFTECCHICMCCKNSRHREKGKVGPSDEGSYKEQNRENFARLDKKRKEREKAEKKRQQIKEAKLRREERGAWVSSLNPFGRQERAAYRGGEVLLKAQEDDLEAPPSGAKEPNPFKAAPLVGKEAARQPRSKRDERPFKERMAEAKKKSSEIRCARKVQRRWRKHVENKQLARGLAKGAVQHKKTRGGAYHEKKLELGGDYLQYANPTDAKGKPRRSSMGQKLRGKEPSTRLKLSEVAAVAAMEDPLSWSLMMKDGTSYEFKADSADSRQTWVRGVQERMRSLARSHMDQAVSKVTGGRF